MEIIIAFALPLALGLAVAALVLALRSRDRSRFAATARRWSLLPADDHAAVGAAVGMDGTVWEMQSDVGRLAGLDAAILRRTSTLGMTPTAAWVRDEDVSTGVVAALRATATSKTTGFLTWRSSTRPGMQIVVARLPHAIDGRLLLEPRYAGFDPERVAGAEDRLVDAGMMAPTLDDDLLGRWYGLGGGDVATSIVRTDRRLRATLWALRTKVTGAREHIADAERVELESLVPPTQRTTRIESVTVDGDLLVLIGQSFPWQVGISDSLLDIAEAVAADR